MTTKQILKTDLTLSSILATTKHLQLHWWPYLAFWKDRWIPPTKGQWCTKRFHIMTSSLCTWPAERLTFLFCNIHYSIAANYTKLYIPIYSISHEICRWFCCALFCSTFVIKPGYSYHFLPIFLYCFTGAATAVSVEKSSTIFMMMSSNGDIFRVTGHLCGEFTGPRWIPHTKASDAELWC